MNSRFEDWANLSEEQYEQEKKFMINRTLVDLDRYLPEIAPKIDWVEAATPRTFNHYTLHTCWDFFWYEI